MSWEQELFAYLEDLEGQAGALYDAERVEELADRSRAEYREVTLAARLAASVGREVAVDVAGVGVLSGRLERVARGWCLLSASGQGASGQDWVLRTPTLAAVSGAAERALPEVAWPAVARLGLASALRRLAEAEERCVLHLVTGGRHDGVLRRVGADFVEVEAGERRRLTLVAFDALAAVSSARVG